MAVTQNTYTGDGTTVLFSFTFPYLETADIKVSVGGTITTAYTLANATTVEFNTAPANGADIRIFRQTDDADLAATFYPGSAIRSQDLNENFTQNLYVTQEVNNYAIQDNGDVTLNASYTFTKPVNGVTPVNNSHLTTKQYVDALAFSATGIGDGIKGGITVSGSGTVWSLNDNTVTTDKIVNGTIVDGDISAAAAIAGSKIQAASTTNVGAVQLNDTTSSTSTSEAATANSVKSAWDLANAAVPKALVDAKGDLLVATAADTVDRLGVGTNGHVLTADSAETAGVKWAEPSRGAWKFISSVTASNSATVNFTGLDSTYAAYVVHIAGVYNAGQFTFPTLGMRFSSNNGTSYLTSGYSQTLRRFTSSLTSTDLTANSRIDIANENTTYANINCLLTAWVELLGFGQASTYAGCRFNATQVLSNSPSHALYWSHAIQRSVTGCNAVSFGDFANNINIAAGTFRLYGLNPS
jgi:hypothetical protein